MLSGVAQTSRRLLCFSSSWMDLLPSPSWSSKSLISSARFLFSLLTRSPCSLTSSQAALRRHSSKLQFLDSLFEASSSVWRSEDWQQQQFLCLNIFNKYKLFTDLSRPFHHNSVKTLCSLLIDDNSSLVSVKLQGDGSRKYCIFYFQNFLIQSECKWDK